jgi:hypothetical protein
MHPVLAPKLFTDMIKLGFKVLCDMHVACSSFHSEAMCAGVDSLFFCFFFGFLLCEYVLSIQTVI